MNGSRNRLPVMRHPRWPVRSVIVAATFTLATFVVLPYVESMAPTGAPAGQLIGAHTVDLPAPPPPRHTEPRREVKTPKPPRPKLAEEKQKLPLSVSLNLDLAIGDVGGDFDLDFELVTSRLLHDTADLVFEPADLDRMPRATVQLRPTYPPQARMRKIEGMVRLEFVVGTDGKTSDIRVVSSTADGMFDGAAVRAAKRWRFDPGTKDGKAVPVRVRQKILFRLDE
jgi:protein TonB